MSLTHQSPHARSADLLAAGFSSALVAVITDIGQSLGLAPVAWSVAEYPDGLVVEGRVSALEADGVPTCEAWAAALGMSEYSWLGDHGQRSWHLERGAWTVEISCD